MRLGYAELPAFTERLEKRGFAIAAQARDSARMISLADDGLFLPYEEKDRTGIVLRDANGATLFHTRYPQRAYESFEAVPPLVRDSLLFIEDKYLLAADQPNRNLAIDWGRFFPCARQPGRARLNISARLQRVGYSPAKFHLRMTRDEMGSYLGLQLETVSRSFSKFQKASLIELRGKQINIVDRGGLERI